MKFLNGWKTALGIVGTFVTVAVSAGGDIGRVGEVIGNLAVNLDAVVVGMFGALASVGIIHKVEKGRK